MTELLNTQQVAERLGVTDRQVRALVRNGQLKPSAVIRGASVFTPEDVEAFRLVRRPRGRPRKLASTDDTPDQPDADQPA